MNCLEIDVIIQYLDNELPDNERKNVGKHIAFCEKCRKKTEDVREQIESVMSGLEMLNPEKVTVPQFEYHAVQTGYSEETVKSEQINPYRRIGISRLYTRILIPAAAILIFILIVISTMSDTEIEIDPGQIEAFLNPDYDILVPDANSWWTERRLVIEIIDENEKLIERIITAKNKENVVVESLLNR